MGSSQTQSFQMNGAHEESGSIQGSSSSSSLLQKIMTPAPVEYDTGSLKRRDPRKMFTDSSFYNAAHHPTVADQVEMAHRLSSAMFNDKNSSSKGQKMYLTRVQNSGGMHDDDYQSRHDSVPNMKLVMNPEGKVHEWDDLPEDQKPDYQQMAVHAAPNIPLPDVADPVAESLNAGIGKGGELFAKRRQRAENWVVDETSIGQAKPSAFADKFMQEQTQQQLAFQQQKQLEQQQREQISQQQISQEQSLEIRRQQEEQARMAQQQMELPPNYKHTDLKARSFTPSLDLGVHNVQGINVWANTAPRGWSTSYQRTKATPPKSDPPTVSVCPATPSLDTEIIQQRMQETKIAEHEEQMRMQQEQQMQMQMQMQQEEQMRIQMEQQEQIRVQEENMRLQQQQEEMRRQQEEQMRIQRQQEEQMRIQQQQEEQRRIQMQQEEEARAAAEMRRQQEEAERQRQEQLQRQQQEEQMRIQQQQEEQRRIQMQQQEAAERQRQEQIQRQEMERQQQMMMQQQSMSQISSSSTTTKSGGFAVESRPEPLLSESQLAQPPMSSSSLFESSQSQGFAQQSSSIQQSSSSFSQSQSSKEVYESQQFSGGVMKGYTLK